MAEESENLHTWLDDLICDGDASVPCNSAAAKLQKRKEIPVRSVSDNYFRNTSTDGTKLQHSIHQTTSWR